MTVKRNSKDTVDMFFLLFLPLKFYDFIVNLKVSSKIKVLLFIASLISKFHVSNRNAIFYNDIAW